MRTLFIVDDDKIVLLGLKYWFVRKGYAVRTFENSKALYPALQDFTPDFILLDVNLHGEYGFNICRHLKEYLNVHTAIYLWSAAALSEEDIARSGADGFILKPAHVDVLEEIIDTEIKKTIH